MRNNLLLRHLAGILYILCIVVFSSNAWAEESAKLSAFKLPSIEGKTLASGGIANDSRTGAKKAPKATTAAVNISGSVNASTLENNSEVVLTGNTTIYMDVNKTLKSISGDYTLTLNGGNILTLDNSGGYAINVATVTISAPVRVVASYVAICAQNGISINANVEATSTNTCIGTVKGDININANVIATTTSSAAILNKGGHIIINSGTVNATGGTSGDWPFGIASMGRITSAEGTTINATGGTAIYSEQNYINFAGSVTATAKGAKGYGIYAKNANVTVAEANIPQSYIAIGAEHDININGTTVANSTNTCIGTIDGTIIVNADLTATTTSSAALLSRQGRIAIQSGTTTVTGGFSGYWPFGIAAGTRVSSKAGTTVNATGWTAIYVENGDISLLGTTTATAKGTEGYGIYAKAGSATLSQVTVPQSFIAIGVANGLTLNGIVDAKSTNTCIGSYEGTLTINADVTATTTSSAAILNRSGNIIINSGTINVSGGVNGDWHYGIAAMGNITATESATINATGGTAIYSETGNINLAGSVTATAKHSEGYGIYAKAGSATLSQITVPQSFIAIGATNGLTLNGTVDAKSTNTCIGSYEGTLTINADVTATTTSSTAILNRNGDIIINSGTINVSGGVNGDWHYGIAAMGNITATESATINATGGTAIYSETGNINLAGSVTATAKHSEGYGIYAKAGSATLSQVTVPQSFVAIGAANGLTLNGTVDAKSTNICIGAYEGTLTINADVTATTTSSTAILNRNGDIIINSGNVTATGGTSGDWPFGIAALGNIDVKDGVVIAKGGSNGILAQNGTISITPPLIVITAAGGGISADGHTVEYDNGDPALRVVIMDPPVGGVVSLSSAPSPGNAVGFTLSGEIASAQTENTWQISDDDVNWQDIVESPTGAPAHAGVHQQRRAVTTLTYTPKESEMGKYLRVKVAAAGHTGYIYSPSRQIAKKICTDVPVVPTLTNINDKVYLSNAKTTQEYIIFNYSKEASSLTASDWNNAVTPESEVGFFELGGSSNANNTVFTRVKETPSTLVGEQIAEARMYIGTSVYMTDVELSVSKTVGYFQNINNELNCKKGDVIRCDASPVPSNATNWYGVSGSNWTVDFHNTGSQYGTFYEDAECTRPISSSSNYSTVYLKTLQEKNYLDVRILVYNSAIGYKTRYVQFNVTPDGYFPLLDYINGCDHTIAAGEKITGIEVSRRPFSGSVYGLTTEVSGEGTAPIVSFSLYETMTINAINATPGVYVYTPLQNGHPLNNNTTFTITVTDGKYAVDSLILRENAITADPNEELELVAQLMPSNSEAAITWTSSNPSVATVTNGIVTIAANAPIGTKATITATANGKSDECQITVSGEEYDLYVASTRVTSRNRDDILGDGKFAFDGMNTLAIKGNYTISNSANLVRNTGIDGLIIDVAQACTISQGSESYSTLFDLRNNTTIRGKQMTVNGNGVAFGTQKGMILTLDSANLVVNAIMPFKGSGIADDYMNIINSRVEVNASGSAAIFSFTGGISLTDCYIQTPAGGEVVNGAIEDGKGSQVRNLLIVPSPEKVDPALAFASSEATATINEAFVAPVLNNPNGLTVSYYSEDPMVAIVNAETGEVTPVAAGTTTITAYTNGDLFHEAGEVSYSLTVLKGTVSLAFSAPTASVKVDATEFVLPILSNPQDVEVTYSSSNPAVATMFALTGDVTLVAAGTTTITATFAGNEAYNATSASYTLTVMPRSYTITWLQDDGSLIGQTIVDEGQTPTHPDPSKPATAEFTYTFAGWTPNIVAATADATYTATYNSTKNSYTVTFVDKDDKTLKTEKVEFGKAATAPEAPAVEGYHFTGWDKDFSNITGDLTVKAQYAINTYTVTFVNWDGKELKSETVDWGKSAIAPSDPSREGYTFTGWDKKFDNVTSNLTVTAQYTINVYTVTFVDKDGKTIKSEDVEWGHAATAPDAPAVEGYHFTGWDKKFDNVTSDLTVKALYAINVYTVTFADKDGKTIKSKDVEWGHAATAPDAPVVEGYTFTGWDKDFSNITSDLTVKALYAINVYTVTFADKEGKTIKTEDVEHGKSATAPDAPAVTGYHFTGWDKAFDKVTSDLTVKALYAINVYTVTFADKDGNTIKTEDVEHGKSATAPDAPVVEGYTFTGWDKDFSNITSDLTVKAQYTINVYTVTFVDKDGNTLKTEKVEYGKAASAPDAPVVTGWTFAGWDKAFNVVKSDLTVQATYTKNPVYTVTFKDYDGSTIAEVKVEESKSAVKPDDPIREGYTFTGWDKDFSNVTSDLTITAQYTINVYTVTFVDKDEKTLKTEEVEHGKSATAPDAPAVTGYHFTGWDKAFDKVTSDLTVKAQYTINVYTVTFVDKDGNTLKTEKVEYGKAASAPDAPAVEGYTFTGWDKKFDKVTSDLTVKALYAINVYTVTFEDKDGKTIKVEKVEYGKAATAPDAPVVEGYTFTGWDKAFDKVTSDLTVKALYAINVYTVTFEDKDGKTIKTEDVEHGKAATAPDAPAVEGYTFKGWDKAFDKVTSDLTVKAQYTINVYTVTFVDKDGKTIKVEKVEYGKAATAPEAPVVEGWTFAGWDKAFNVVKSDLTVQATYTKNPVYTVTFKDYDGSTIAEIKVEEGKSAVKPDDPIREGYTFTGWDKDFSNVTSDLTITAQYTINVYTVTFLDKDNKTIKTEKVEYGKAATAPEAPAVEGYHFTGWDKKFNNITSDLTVKALYAINVYTVTFVDKDGNTLKTVQVEHGKSATAPDAPVVEGWTFAGWDKAFNVVKSDLTVQATYTKNPVYTVTFKDYDGSTIAEVKVEEGKSAVKPDDPIREGYTFTGWDKKFDNVTSDLTITAQYTINVYTVTFADKDGKTIKTEDVEWGKYATAPDAPVVEGYHFTGWDKKFDNVTSDLTVQAQYAINVYTVTFVDKDGKTIKVEKVEHGKAATAPDAPVVEGYHFAGWDKAFNVVKSDLTVQATYTKNPVYTVTFKDYDGSTIAEVKVEEGKSAVKPDDPIREGYIFIGWDKSFDNVTSDLTVTALYEAIPDFTPQNLSVTLEELNNDLRITLAWDKVEGAVSYDLRMAIGEKELFTRNTMTLTSLTALLSQIEEQYHLTPGTYLIDWFVRSTDKDGEAISEWAQGESFEVTIKEPQGIEDVNADANTTVRKEMRNGLLYIIRGGRTYDSNGKLVQ